MEAVQQFPGDGHGFVPQFSRDMLLPLMEAEHTLEAIQFHSMMLME